ncbi:MAG: hypothetical protein ACE3JP_16020 [Ectobacillus sp.]
MTGNNLHEPLFTVPSVQVQPVHQSHALMAACIQDNHIMNDCFAVILDETKYRAEGKNGSFEMLYGNGESFERLAHLHYIPFLDGGQSKYEPWKIAVSYLVKAFGIRGIEIAKTLFPQQKQKIPLLYHVIVKEMNTPISKTDTGLFDAVGAIIGICGAYACEGEAAAKLSELVRNSNRHHNAYPYFMENKKPLEWNPALMIQEIVKDVQAGVSPLLIALTFHETIVRVIKDMIIQSQNSKRNKIVLLLGSLFCNLYLREYSKEALEEAGYRVYTTYKEGHATAQPKSREYI